MNRISRHILMIAVSAVSLGACAPQSTPSMMNVTKPTLAQETMLEQVAVADANDAYLTALAERHKRYGAEAMQMSLAYNPDSREYSSLKAFTDLTNIKDRMRKRGVAVKADTVQADVDKPTLMISFDTVTARPPEGCQPMPGLENGLTTRHVGSYKFGCSLDTLAVQQLYRPADLAGVEQMDPIDGRKSATGMEFERIMTADEAEAPLNTYQRDDIQN